MSVTNASRTVDWQPKSPNVHLTASDLRAVLQHAFISVLSRFHNPTYCELGAVLHFQRHCLRSFEALSVEKNVSVVVLDAQRSVQEMIWDGCRDDPQHRSVSDLEELCLPAGCTYGEQKRCTPAWAGPVLRLPSLHRALSSCPHSCFSNSGLTDRLQKIQAGRWSLAWGGYIWGFVCVLKGSAGASASWRGEDRTAVRFLGTSGEPAGEQGTHLFFISKHD